MDAKVMERAEGLAKELAGQAKTIEHLNSLMKALIKSAIEQMLSSELNVHLKEPMAAIPEEMAAEPRSGRNRRNGTNPKSVQGNLGKVAIDVPRDRERSFEPQLVAKHQRRLAGFEERILALYAKGVTTRDIQQIIKELYGVDVSPFLVSEITSNLDSEVKAWQTRRLEAVYPMLFMDGIVVHVRSESGQVREHTMFVAIGVNFARHKELLGLWLNESEGAKFWLSCLTDLQNRGVKDVFIVSVDGLSGFPEAINSGKTRKTRTCIVVVAVVSEQSATCLHAWSFGVDLSLVDRF